MGLAAALSFIPAVAFILTTALVEEPSIKDAPGKTLQTNVDWGFAAYTGHAGRQTSFYRTGGVELFACDVRDRVSSAWPAIIGKSSKCPSNLRSPCQSSSLPRFPGIFAVPYQLQPQRAAQCFMAPRTS